MSDLNKHFLYGRLSKRVAIRILAASSCITALSIIWQISSDYRLGINRIEESLEKIESSTIPILARSLWNLDADQVRLILDGIARIPDVTGIEVMDANNTVYQSYGNMNIDKGKLQSFALRYNPNGSPQTIGSLRVVTSLQNLNQQILNSLFRIIISQFLKSIIMTAVIMWIFYQFVSKHLQVLALLVKDVETHSEPHPIDLKRPQSVSKADELDAVVQALNRLLISNHQSNLKLQASVMDRMRVQDELLKAQQELALSEFATGIIHDLNNILNIVTGTSYNLGLMWKQVSSNVRPEATAQITANINRLNSASDGAARVANLLLTHAQSASDADNVSLLEAVKNVLLLQEYALKKIKVQSSITIPEDLHAKLGKGVLMTVLLNLVKNSIEAFESMDNDQTATISFVAEASFDRQSLILWVTDNGPGIPEEIRSKMFHHGFTTKESGHGFGLHFCQSLLAKFDATIRVSDSQVGRGTTFTLILPAAETRESENVKDQAS